MKAAQYNKYGDTSVIEINENAASPHPAKGQILVEVYAAGINPVESAIRNGYTKDMLPLTFPVNIGGDFSGVVSQVGEGVSDFKIGDEVYGIANHFKGGSGSVAELVASNASNSGPKPASIDHVQAASLPLTGTSALQALEEHINIKNGQKILIHGGAGGVGSIAIQIAKAHGAYVVTTVSSDDIEFVKDLGADQVIDYKTQDFTTLIKDLDAVLDTTRADAADKSIPFLKDGGVLVAMASQPDQELAKKHKVTALTQMTKGDTQQLARLKELVDSGKVKPVVDKTFSLEQSKEAYDALEKNPRGKVVIKIK
jgi:NADPH:quinone reductase-like Zn-dependent oxidoreductase